MTKVLSYFNIVDKKKQGKELTKEEIQYFIDQMMSGGIEDYQVTALLMAIYLKGFSKKETAALTAAMLNSGVVLPMLGKNVVDKHSTGGVGDKTSFIVAPIAAALGVKVPMIAGRGLGHTGGTVDKLEAIKGIKTAISSKDFVKTLDTFGLVLMGQTDEIAPADKKIYALRDVTCTVDHVGLITASIMSKKLAEGAHGYVLDIKVGNGAFMQEMKKAKELATSLVNTGKDFKRKCIALITDMNEPLGTHIGHSLELIECFEALKGRGESRLMEVSLALVSYMIYFAGKASSVAAAKKMAEGTIADGSALKKFKEMIIKQGGDGLVVDEYNRLPMAPMTTVITAPKKGFYKGIETKQLGEWLIRFGGGRKTKADLIDHGVGFIMHKTVGDTLSKNEPFMTIYHHAKQKQIVDELQKDLWKNLVKIAPSKLKKPAVIHATVK